MLTEIAKIAWRNTLKNWRHSLSALLSLAASFVSLVVFDGYMKDIDHVFSDAFRHKQMLGDLMIQDMRTFSKDGVTEPWKYWLTESDQEKIQNFLDQNKQLISHVNRSLNFQGMAANGKQSFIFLGRGYDSQPGAQMRGPQWAWNTPLGIPLDQSTEENTGVVGFGFAKKMGCQIPEAFPFMISEGFYPAIERPLICPNYELQLSNLTPEGQLNAIDLKIVGIIDGGYKDIDDRFLHSDLKSAQLLMNTSSISYVSLQVKSDSSKALLIDKFASFSKSNNLGNGRSQTNSDENPIQMRRWQDHPAGEPYTKTMDFLDIFRNFIIVVILVVSTLSVVNTMVKIVKERTREIGTLRSIGFRRSDVLKLFLVESFYLAQIGSLLGAIASALLSMTINFIGIEYKAGMLSNPIYFQIHFVPNSYLYAWLLLVVVSFIASLVSTFSILRGKVIENLAAT